MPQREVDQRVLTRGGEQRAVAAVVDKEHTLWTFLLHLRLAISLHLQHVLFRVGQRVVVGAPFLIYNLGGKKKMSTLQRREELWKRDEAAWNRWKGTGVEIWAPILDFPNFLVSSYGAVKNHVTDNTMKANASSGYDRVALRNATMQDNVRVSKLVADAFLKPVCRHVYTHVDHKDGNRRNNYFGNLENSTAQLNMYNKEMHRQGKKGTVYYNRRLKKWSVNYRMPGTPLKGLRQVAHFEDEVEARDFAREAFQDYKNWLLEDAERRAAICPKCRRDPSTSHPASWSET